MYCKWISCYIYNQYVYVYKYQCIPTSQDFGRCLHTSHLRKFNIHGCQVPLKRKCCRMLHIDLSISIPINASKKSQKDELQTKAISENQAPHISPSLPRDLETMCFHLRQPIAVSVSWNHGIDRIPRYCKISDSQILLLKSSFSYSICAPGCLTKRSLHWFPVVVDAGSSAGLSSMGIAGLAAVALAAGRPTAQRGSIAVQAYDAWLEAQTGLCCFFLFSCFFWEIPFFFRNKFQAIRGIWERKQTWHSFQVNKHSWTCSRFADRKYCSGFFHRDCIYICN